MPLWAKRSTVAGVVLVVAAGVVISAGIARGEDDDPPLADAAVSRAAPNPDRLDAKVARPLVAERGKVTAFVELAQQSAVDAYKSQKSSGSDEARQAALRARADVARSSSTVVGTLRSADQDTKVLYSTVNAVPGVVVQADAAKVRELAQLPEVQSVRAVVPKTRTNASADQLTKALNVWQQTGKFGEGVRVGVIDDGIDYTHADFGGPGTPEAYKAVDHTKIDPSYFPTAKVVGGVDLAGDNYDSAGKTGSATPVPDPNPIACGEHGTHVSGTIAGYGVNADGSTFTGDYGALDATSLNAMRIGPGTAPKAQLYGIKVFGCHGSTSLSALAMDWALDPNGDGDFSDHLDMVNMSLGSDFGAPDDPDSLFVRQLSANGVLAVISAGNGGDLYDVGGSPGMTPEALTVASARDAFVLRDAAEATGPADLSGGKPGQYSQSFTGYDTYDATKPVVVLDTGDKDGCAPYSETDKAAVAGKYVWLEWDDNDASRACGSGPRADNATAAGAAGVLLGSGVDQFAAGIAGNAEIPMFQFSGTATTQLRPALTAGTLQVRLAGKLRSTLHTTTPEITDTPSTFTSRGVRGPAVKPDVSAPGDTIASALAGSGANPLVISGTSMAAPHTTGIAALVHQAHPDWTPEQIKADVMNTAEANVHSGDNASGKVEAPQRVGAGRIDASAAVDNQVLAMAVDDRGSVSVSFGTVEVTDETSLTKTVKVVNTSAKAVEFDAVYKAINQMPGVRYELSDDSVYLAPGATGTLDVTLEIDDPAQLRKTIDASVDKLQSDLPRQFLADASGLIVLTPTSGSIVPLRVPVYAAPKPVGAITTAPALKFRSKSAETSLLLSGHGLNQGTGDSAYRSLVSVLELQATSPQLPACTKTVTSACTPNETAKGGDLRYVGAASTAPAVKAQGKPEDAVLAFGIVTWANWYNLGSNTIPYVDIDTDNDGKADFETYVTKLTATDVLVAATVDLAKKSTVDVQPLNGLFGDLDANVFDTDVAVLPVRLNKLGIDPAKDSARLSYTVGVAGYYAAPGDDSGSIDQLVGSVSFDPLKPGLSVRGDGGSALSYVAKPGTSLVVDRDPAALTEDKGLGLLALQHHNASGHRAAVIEVPGTTPGTPTGSTAGHRSSRSDVAAVGDR